MPIKQGRWCEGKIFHSAICASNKPQKQERGMMIIMKKLQVALDLFSTKATLEVLQKVGKYVDIIELGTPLMIAEGAAVVKTVKEKYPDKIVFADIKVMDGGGEVPKSVLEAGADMFSVLAASDNSTIKSAMDLAAKYHAKVLIDMCSVKNMEERGKEIEAMKPDYICCHVGYDVQASGVDPIEELHKLDSVAIPKAIAGGIKLATFEAAVQSPAEVIISGGGIYNQPDMEEVAKQMRLILDAYNQKAV
jgi:3-hexulose-6-phosphate synthase and related proteins